MPPSASDLARHIRTGLEAEEIVDLWNVVFPADRNVWYDEFLVSRCNEHINTEFREFLVSVGCSAATMTHAGY